jgi:hypothetical protein
LLPRCSLEVDALRFCFVAALPLSFPFAALCHFCSLVVAVLDNRVRRFLRSVVVELRRVLSSVGFLALFPGVCACVHLFFLLFAALLLPCQRVEVAWRFLKNDNGNNALLF